MFLLPRYSLATVEDSQCGVSGYIMARCDGASGGRNTLQRIPEETAGEGGGGVGGGELVEEDDYVIEYNIVSFS